MNVQILTIKHSSSLPLLTYLINAVSETQCKRREGHALVEEAIEYVFFSKRSDLRLFLWKFVCWWCRNLVKKKIGKNYILWSKWDRYWAKKLAPFWIFVHKVWYIAPWIIYKWPKTVSLNGNKGSPAAMGREIFII